jgi:hypothetical protein
MIVQIGVRNVLTHKAFNLYRTYLKSTYEPFICVFAVV